VPLEAGVAAWPPDGKAPPAAPSFRSRGGDACREGVSDTPRVPLVSKDAAARLAVELGLEPGQAQRAPFRVLLNHPTLAVAANGLLRQLLFDGLLDARVRELIIMRIAWQTGSAVEWARHWLFCQRVGLAPEEVVAVRDWQAAGCFSDAERAALGAVDETLATGTVSDPTWATCAQAFPSYPLQLELIFAIGHWRMYSQVLRSASIPFEEGETAWAPDGRGPVPD